MTCQGKWGVELIFAQRHTPAFPEALLIGGGEALQLDGRDPRSDVEAIIQEFSDALEERSLHRRIKPRHERLHAGVEKAQGSLGVVPRPARQIAESAPVM